MAPDVKIRNLDQPTYDLLKSRADAEGLSMESLLREIVAGAVGSGGVSSEDWKSSGFDEVDEVLPGRLYDVWALGDHYRIYIGRGILGGSSVKWHSEFDKEVVINGERVWTTPTGVPSRHFGDTPDEALRDAMRWLAEWGRFNQMGRAQRDAEAAERMEPALQQIADAVDELFGSHASETWRDETRASWSTADLDFFISRTGDKIALMTYEAGTSRLAFAPQHFLFVTDAARKIVDTMYLHMAGEGEPVSRSRTKP